MSAGTNARAFLEQVKEFNPKVATLASGYEDIKSELPVGVKYSFGENSFKDAIIPSADIVVISLVGYKGVVAVLDAVEKGKDIRYCYTETELEQIKAEMGKGYTQQRYKGLGEMTAEQLWETTMSPEHRTMIKVTMEDAFEADQIFTSLMGDDPELRRQFIEQNATLVEDLDI
jgi:hypothetical protein